MCFFNDCMHVWVNIEMSSPHKFSPLISSLLSTQHLNLCGEGKEVGREWVDLCEVAWTIDIEHCLHLSTLPTLSSLLSKSSPSSSTHHSMSDINHILSKQEIEGVERRRAISAYYLSTLRFLSSLVKGRNYHCIHAISHQFSYNLLLTSSFSSSLPFQFRQVFLPLLKGLYVDVFPHNPLILPSCVVILSPNCHDDFNNNKDHSKEEKGESGDWGDETFGNHSHYHSHYPIFSPPPHDITSPSSSSLSSLNSNSKFEMDFEPSVDLEGGQDDDDNDEDDVGFNELGLIYFEL